MKHKISLLINGNKIEKEVPSYLTAVDFIREELNLTGTKKGCGNGECGACTIIVNNKAIRSCLILATELDNTEVITIEGLMKNGELDLIQKIFIEEGAIQCGFCTPGFIMAIKASILSKKKITEQDLIESIKGHLCRCTGYVSIINSVKKIAYLLNDN